MQPWEKIKPDEEIKVGWRKLVHKTFQHPDGATAEYVTLGAMGSRCGAVIALTPDNRVVVAQQFRAGPEKIMYELPGGGIKADEDPSEAVMRELREETGYTSNDVSFLGKIYKGAATNTMWYYFLAKNCTKLHDQELDDGEFVIVNLITVDELLENAKNSLMTDTEALFLAYDQLVNIKKETKQ